MASHFLTRVLFVGLQIVKQRKRKVYTFYFNLGPSLFSSVLGIIEARSYGGRGVQV